MISREEAEKMLGEPITQPPIKDRKRYQDWLGDVSILNFPRLARRILTEDAIFLIHFGHTCGYMLDILETRRYERKVRYKAFVKELRTIAPLDVGTKSILAFIPHDHKNEAVNFIGVDRNSLILVPTIGTISIGDILRMYDSEFLPKLSQYVKSAHLRGELYATPEHDGSYAYGGCVYGIERKCENLIKTHIDIDLTYSLWLDP